jgi:hypothetical protein
MDWEVGLSVQRQVVPRMSLEVGWHRRWIDKWTLINNVANSYDDFQPYWVASPADSRLGVASGRVIDDQWNIIPSKFGLMQNETVLENNIEGADRKNWWNGVDVNVNARLANGLTIRGGAVLSTSGDDYCTYKDLGYYGTGIVEGPSHRNCRSVSPWQPEYRALGTYTIPRIDVQVAGTLTSRPGPQKVANYQYFASEIAQTLGRLPSGAAGPTSTTTINLFNNNEEFYPQITIVDLRVGKILRMGRLRANVALDVYNSLNASTGQTYNATYSRTNPALWGTPTLILPARFAKVGVQLDF